MSPMPNQEKTTDKGQSRKTSIDDLESWTFHSSREVCRSKTASIFDSSMLTQLPAMTAEFGILLRHNSIWA
jgi:hypothetical protein